MQNSYFSRVFSDRYFCKRLLWFTFGIQELYSLKSNNCIKFIQYPYASKLEVIPIEQAAWDGAIWKLHGSHHCWMIWLALDKENLLQPSSASTRECENSWPELWLLCLLRRLTWVAAETMRLSTHSVPFFFNLSCHKDVKYIFIFFLKPFWWSLTL